MTIASALKLIERMLKEERAQLRVANREFFYELATKHGHRVELLRELSRSLKRPAKRAAKRGAGR